MTDLCKSARVIITKQINVYIIHIVLGRKFDLLDKMTKKWRV